ncbi:MAG: DNA cytosine methyltransferase [Atopobiaceae bacterium]|nr:DNA cytosine methyltransferase [Atopobiaceae bacterium]
MRKLLELFAGTRSIGRAFERRGGWDVFSIDWDETFPDIDMCCDIMDVTPEAIVDRFGRPDVIWASPDCSSYSVAAISHHRKKESHGNLAPQTDYARYSDRVNMHLHNLIMALSPSLWFIENPRAGMRSMDFMHGLDGMRHTVCYCKYGDTRQKPTDIWSNHPDPQFKPPCKAGDPCHERAPRGSRTGTQGINGSKARSVIPDELCDHIAEICSTFDWDKWKDREPPQGRLF